MRFSNKHAEWFRHLKEQRYFNASLLSCHLLKQRIHGFKIVNALQAGDLWLDAKGKRSLPGTEDRLGRRDLFEALHRGITSNNASPSGDIWIDRLGKRYASNPVVF